MSESDTLEFLASLPSTEGYTPMDRYRDFRKVFGTEEGKKVLREILSWGRMLRSPVLGSPVDPYAMAIAFGERNMALRLLATAQHEPPVKTQRTRKKHDDQPNPSG